MQAKATFTIANWDEEPYDKADGATRLRGTVEKNWEGGLVGTSTAALLMVHAADGPAAYTAQERFTGTVDGRSGTFVTQHGAAEDSQPPWVIITGSGTGELDADGAHEFTLDYDLD